MAMDMSPIQFGNHVKGTQYIPRPGAYAVILKEDQRVALIEDNGRYHLPGGGIHENESLDDALAREVFEEIGIIFTHKKYIGSVNQYCGKSTDKRCYNKLCHYFLITQFSAGPSIKDAEHTTIWMSPEDAKTHLDHESHAWAVMQAIKQIQRD